MMDSLFDASVLLLLFIIIYFTVMSVYKFYISMKYYNELDEYRKHKLMDWDTAVLENNKINHNLDIKH